MSKTLSAKYYQEKKERLKKSLQKISKSLQKRNRKKWQYGRKHYKNLSKGEMQKLVGYRKKYYRMRKNTLL